MKKYVYSILICLLCFMLIGCNNNEDAITFKKEYESLNNKDTGYGDFKYPSVSISSNNPVKYVDADGVLDILDNKSGIVFFGYPECPWCRNAIPVLLEASEALDFKDVYYFNVKEERDEYKVLEDGTLKEVSSGTDGYKKILKRLDDVLDDYTLEDVKGNSVNVGEKRIYVPLALFVREGEVVGIHVDTVSSQTNPFVKLNEDQTNELMDIYIELIHKVLNDVCDSKC